MAKKDKDDKNAGKRGQKYTPQRPIVQAKTPVSCSRCGGSFPPRLDDATTPSQHYRVVDGNREICD
jgi:hypothetical protein